MDKAFERLQLILAKEIEDLIKLHDFDYFSCLLSRDHKLTKEIDDCFLACYPVHQYRTQNDTWIDVECYLNDDNLKLSQAIVFYKSGKVEVFPAKKFL